MQRFHFHAGTICHCNYRRSLDGIGGQEFGLMLTELSVTDTSLSLSLQVPPTLYSHRSPRSLCMGPAGF